MRNPRIEELFFGLAHSEGFQALTGRLAASSSQPSVLRLSGLTPTAKAVYSALLYRETRLPQIIITDGNKQAEALYPLLRTFCDLLDAGTAPLLLPALDVLPGQGLTPHAEILADRAAALDRLAHGRAGIVVVPIAAALTRLEAPSYYRQLTLTLKVHEEIGLDDLAQHLESIGYERRDPVEGVGEYSIRGGIMDVFSPDQAQPVRMEFFGDEIESIRRFDPESQRSVHKLNECVLQPLSEFQKRRAMSEAPPERPRESSIVDFFTNPLVVIDEPELTKPAAERFEGRLRDAGGAPPETIAWEWDELLERARRHDVLETRQLDLAMPDEDSFHISTRPSMAFHGNLQVAIREAKTLIERGTRIVVLRSRHGRDRTPGRCVRRVFGTFPDRSGGRSSARVSAGAGAIERESASPSSEAKWLGVRCSSKPGWLSSGRKICSIRPEPRCEPGISRTRAFSADQFDLKPGDYVVHVEHGVGQFLGVREIAQGDAKGDYMLLEYAGGNKLYVPLARMDLVQRFRGEGEAKPSLDKMGGATWTRTKTRIKTKMRDMAEELLKLYAQRKLAEGFSFSSDSNWQREFEDAFEFTETRDQKTAIADIKRDMESPQPMDRLLCGDVGYGKTEVVMRAAFKALGDGKQVAVLSPTTVLCFQHFNTFRKRFQPFPVRIEMLSRFRSAKEIKAVLDDLAEGKVDLRGRHASAVLERRGLEGPRPCDHRRRTALRRQAQGASQRDVQGRRRDHHERHADSAHPAHVDAGTARYVGDRDAAEGPARHPHRCRAVRSRSD